MNKMAQEPHKREEIIHHLDSMEIRLTEIKSHLDRIRQKSAAVKEASRIRTVA